jgi:hypothetical protein
MICKEMAEISVSAAHTYLRALVTKSLEKIGSYLMAMDVMLCYVHVAYVHMRRSTLLVWHSHAPFGP